MPPSAHLPAGRALRSVNDASRLYQGYGLYLILRYNPFNLGLYPVVFFMRDAGCQIKAKAAGRREMSLNSG